MDTERFIILGGSHIERWVAEDEIFKMDRIATVNWIAGGNLEDVCQVLAFDLPRGGIRDATREIALEVQQRWAETDEALEGWQVDFIERHISIQAANAFRRAA